MKEQKLQMLFNIFQKAEGEGKLPNSFCEASITS
jgi:hypothetical protein